MENIYAILINVALDNSKEFADQLNNSAFLLNVDSSIPELRQLERRIRVELRLGEFEMTYVNVLKLHDFVENYNNQLGRSNDYIGFVSVEYVKGLGH